MTLRAHFPYQFDGRGRTRDDDEATWIRGLIEQVLFTAPGERVMRPDFGAGLHRLVFEPISATTMSMVRHRVEQALIRWEPRIDRVEVKVTAEPPVGRLDIAIRYRIRATNTFYNLVYPFYLMEGEQP